MVEYLCDNAKCVEWGGGEKQFNYICGMTSGFFLELMCMENRPEVNRLQY